MREAIAKELVGAVQEIAGNGYAVTTQETTKNNGVKMIGIEIVKQGESFMGRISCFIKSILRLQRRR